jgi:hypothetical protein
MLFVLVGAAGCFRPQPAPGSPCDDTHPCPSELVCVAGSCALEGAPPPDGGTPSELCFGTGIVRVCLDELPTQPLVLAFDATIATDDPAGCSASDTPSVCVLAGTDVFLMGDVRATGARPLVILGLDTVLVAGSLDVASHDAPGAGANAADCAAPDTGDRFGGPGGSFGGRGGAGASSATPLPADEPREASALRGGCRGSTGSANGGTGGEGGHGGGAVALLGGTLTIFGTVNASGSGGRGGHSGGLGGGGGSGGMIVLDAPAITITGEVFANGGGGGGSGLVLSGDPGDDPQRADEPARGGATASGEGGNGSFGGTLDGGDGGVVGGGGGGGAGVIRVFGSVHDVDPAVAPPPR